MSASDNVYRRAGGPELADWRVATLLPESTLPLASGGNRAGRLRRGRGRKLIGDMRSCENAIETDGSSLVFPAALHRGR